ncbi:MAG: proline dehydrogenase family protein [Chloroflexi bacterium]|nr:proline dehydrogenase family protein [Chloroflexota bacterium]
MIRAILMSLSKSQAIKSLILRLCLARRASRRFVAGENQEEVIPVLKDLNAKGMVTTLDILGENVLNPEDARRATGEYLRLLDRLAASGVHSHVSVKLTQMGLDLSQELCQVDLEKIVGKARETGTFVRVDMEGSPYTEATLQAYLSVRQKYSNVGIVIQSYLYRSKKDVEDLIAQGVANVRLCKGAYLEPKSIAFPRKKDVDANYIALAERLFAPQSLANGAYLALATHDARIIAWAKRYVAQHNIPRDRFEFQMLYGIRRDLQQQLAQEGYVMRIYVPFGDQWYPYFMRRLAERPANIFFILGNLLREPLARG